jgi:glycosyltransferase involved in cell wall biosynthesis
MKPEISVIIPLYNSSKFINKLFNSIERQTFSAIEVIFIDDGSSDNSGEIVSRLIASSKSGIIYRLYKQKNLGQQEARLSGLRLARAQKVTFIDGDDWVGSHHFANLIGVADRTGADLVCANYYLTTEKGSAFPKNGVYVDNVTLSRDDFCLRFIEGQIEGFYWNKLFDKDLFDLNHVVRTENYMEDVSGIGAICPKIRIVAFSPNPTYHYIQRRNSAVHVKLDEHKIAGFSHAMEILKSLSLSYGKLGSIAYDYRYLKESIGLLSLAKTIDQVHDSIWLKTFSKKCRVASTERAVLKRFNAYDLFLILHSKTKIHISLFRLRRGLLFLKQFGATKLNALSSLMQRGR